MSVNPTTRRAFVGAAASLAVGTGIVASGRAAARVRKAPRRSNWRDTRPLMTERSGGRRDWFHVQGVPYGSPETFVSADPAKVSLDDVIHYTLDLFRVGPQGKGPDGTRADLTVLRGGRAVALIRDAYGPDPEVVRLDS